MKNAHDILLQIPHERIQSEHVRADERFDIFKLGRFKVANSFLNGIALNENQSGMNEEIVELVELQPNSSYKPHFHEKSVAVIYMILGSGIFSLGKKQYEYSPGQRIEIPAKTPHGFLTKTKTLFLSIQSPPIRNLNTGEVDLHYA